MDQTPVTFEYLGKSYSGLLKQVHGAGASTWFLYVNGYYKGQLMKIGGQWVFHSQSGKLDHLAEVFGGVVETTNYIPPQK